MISEEEMEMAVVVMIDLVGILRIVEVMVIVMLVVDMIVWES